MGIIQPPMKHQMLQRRIPLSHSNFKTVSNHFQFYIEMIIKFTGLKHIQGQVKLISIQFKSICTSCERSNANFRLSCAVRPPAIDLNIYLLSQTGPLYIYS